jgi:hypothetical protein
VTFSILRACAGRMQLRHRYASSYYLIRVLMPARNTRTTD